MFLLATLGLLSFNAQAQDFGPDDVTALLGKDIKSKEVKAWAKTVKGKIKYLDWNGRYNLFIKGDDAGLMFYLDGTTISSLGFNAIHWPGTIYGANAREYSEFGAAIGKPDLYGRVEVQTPEAVIKVGPDTNNMFIVYIDFMPPVPMPGTPDLNTVATWGPVHSGISGSVCSEGDCQNGNGQLTGVLSGSSWSYQGTFKDGVAIGYGTLAASGDHHESLKGTFEGGFPNGRFQLAGGAGESAYGLTAWLEWGEVKGTVEGTLGTDKTFEGECDSALRTCQGDLKRTGWSGGYRGSFILPGFRPHGLVTVFLYNQTEEGQYLPPASGMLQGKWSNGVPNGQFDLYNTSDKVIATGHYTAGQLQSGTDVIKNARVILPSR